MSPADLLRSAQEYVALRRALGFKLYAETWLLPDFVAFLTAHGSPFITTDLAVRWAQQPPGASRRWCARRLSVVRCFAKHQRAFDPRTRMKRSVNRGRCSRLGRRRFLRIVQGEPRQRTSGEEHRRRVTLGFAGCLSVEPHDSEPSGGCLPSEIASSGRSLVAQSGRGFLLSWPPIVRRLRLPCTPPFAWS
jgi:hypothetical protein